jgi:hypothetical protein
MRKFVQPSSDQVAAHEIQDLRGRGVISGETSRSFSVYQQRVRRFAHPFLHGVTHKKRREGHDERPLQNEAGWRPRIPYGPRAFIDASAE